MSSKPEWKDAPPWAMWLAADPTPSAQDEYWIWFEEEPVIMTGNGEGFWYSYQGEWLQDKRFPSRGIDNWRNTLEPRP